MRVVGSGPSLRLARNPLVGFVVLIVVAVIAYQTAELVVANDMNSLAYVAMLFLGGAVVVAILNDWRRGVYMLLAWILFEDLVRKYLGNNMAIYFAKDILAIILYMAFFRARRLKGTPLFKPPFRFVLLLFIWFGFATAFNPLSNSIFYGVLGMKLYFLYIPLMFVGYELIETEADLRRLFIFNAYLILAVVGLGVAQSILGPTFLNPSVIQEDIRELSTLYRAAPISGLIAYRPSSVFVSAGRFQNFLMLSWVVSLGFAGYLLLRIRKGRLLAFLAVGLVAGGSLMSTSRGVFMWNGGSALVICAALLWGAPWQQGEARRILRAIQRTVLFAGIAVIALATIFPEEVGSRLAVYSETLSPSSPSSELAWRAHEYPLRNFLMAFDYDHWVSGYGIGTASLGVQYVARIMHAKPMLIGVENGYGQLIIELGIFGFALWIAVTVSIVLTTWKIARQLRGSPWFPLGFAIFWYAFLLLIPMAYIGLSTFQDFVMNAYLWLLLGILFKLPSLAEKVKTEAALAAGSA